MASIRFLGMTACLMPLCIACDDGRLPMHAPGESEPPAAADERALERLNREREDGRLVFYNRLDVATALAAGGAIAADDEREIWRFSIADGGWHPDRSLQLDLSDQSIHITAHLPDPGCLPREACTMVTLTREEDGQLSASGSAHVEVVPDEGLRLYFLLEAEFLMENGVFGTMRYRGGGYPGSAR